MPKRIQLSRKRGWRKPEGAIVVARPSKWGNPFRVARDQVSWLVHDGDWTLADFRTKAAAAEYAVERFREASKCYDVTDLAGHDLACWCPLEDAEGRHVPCHADVLLELANPGWTP